MKNTSQRWFDRACFTCQETDREMLSVRLLGRIIESTLSEEEENGEWDRERGRDRDGCHV